MSESIIFTGGGSGGHTMPALSLIKKLEQEDRYKIYYIGAKTGIEREIMASMPGVTYFAVPAGKLRRYFSWRNFTDFFKFTAGVCKAFYIIKCTAARKSKLVFSTGGFVSLPAVIAAWIAGKKVFIHEQTARAGLANRIAGKFAAAVLLSFSASEAFFPSRKCEVSGYPLRPVFYADEKNNVLLNGVDIKKQNKQNKPVLFITGGGNGSQLLNNFVKNNLVFFKKEYFVIHQTGASFFKEFKSFQDENYLPAALLGEEIAAVMRAARIVISRSGAGTVMELMYLRKTSLFIPLKIAQKNEQYHNALAAQKELGSVILSEDQLAEVDIREIFRKLETKIKAAAAGSQKFKKKVSAADYIARRIRALYT